MRDIRYRYGLFKWSLGFVVFIAASLFVGAYEVDEDAPSYVPVWFDPLTNAYGCPSVRTISGRRFPVQSRLADVVARGAVLDPSCVEYSCFRRRISIPQWLSEKHDPRSAPGRWMPETGTWFGNFHVADENAVLRRSLR